MVRRKTVSSRSMYSSGDFGREYQIAHRVGTEKYRSHFRRDYGRLIHSPSFRRLQGKTQLFPGMETDFFRNRLTHSIEVAQIAKAIALKLNAECPGLVALPPDGRIDCDLVEIAALAHDIGHPPFGHNGEKALNDQMRRYGGFEGNAQTLRILARLEKRLERGSKVEHISTDEDGSDVRRGLNLTFRTLASILKYDKEIPLEQDDGASLQKGFYKSEAKLVRAVKKAVVGDANIKVQSGEFKTIECQIMDVADDIAYSTYDLEDAFKAEFLNPLALLQRVSHDGVVIDGVLDKVNKNLKKENVRQIDRQDLMGRVLRIFGKVFDGQSDVILNLLLQQTKELAPQIEKQAKKVSATKLVQSVMSSILGDDGRFPIDIPVLNVYHSSNRIAVDGYLRTHFTAELVGRAIEGVEIEFNTDCPALSVVRLNDETRTQVEILKHLTYELIIMSPRLKVVEHRGGDIVSEIFEALSKPGGERLLPNDYQVLHASLAKLEDKRRAICDFIACMTDRYALEFYRRLTEAGESIFKPV